MNRELSHLRVPQLLMAFALLVSGLASAAVPQPSDDPRSEGDTPQMLYADTDYGRPFAKDPDVVRFQGRYLIV